MRCESIGGDNDDRPLTTLLTYHGSSMYDTEWFVPLTVLPLTTYLYASVFSKVVDTYLCSTSLL